MSEASRPGLLEGISVVEVGRMVAAPFCAKLLADLGADVVKIEAPGVGDPARRRGPFAGGEPHLEKSALFLYLNTGKRSITLDLEDRAGRGILRRLLERADILVEDLEPGALERLGFGSSHLADLAPRLVVTSVTPFGQTGPGRHLRTHHLNRYHVGGHSSFWRGPNAEGMPPPRGGAHLGDCDAGLTAAVATVAAILGRGHTGRGRHIDISCQEAMMCLERVDIGTAANSPERRQWPNMVGGLMRARDGWFVVTAIQQHQWQGLMRAMGCPEWAESEWCRDELIRMENRDRIQPLLEKWAAELERDEVYHRCQAEGVPVGPVRNVAEVSSWIQAQERHFFVQLDHSVAGRIELPKAPYLFSKTPVRVRCAPLLGEHNRELLGGELGLGTDEIERLTGPTKSAGPMAEWESVVASKAEARPLPLEGVRVCDFTWAWAGPHGTLLLAMLGAQVIKIESRTRLDHTRLRSLMTGAVKVGPDESELFHHLNLGKLSLTLNLRTEKAREIIHRLVAQCDVVAQNMRPGALDRLGLGYNELVRSRPDLVMLSSSAVGATGPERGYVGYAPNFAALSGAADLTGYADLTPLPLSGSVDLRVGTAAALAVLAALHHRRRTGEGQHIDLSSTEVMTWMVGEAFAEASLTGQNPKRMGNRHPTMAPHGCYRCRGEKQWVTIAVGDEDEWAALEAAIGDPALQRSEFADARSRRRHQDELDRIVEEWTTEREVEEVVAALQAAGVACLPIIDSYDLVRDPHVRERGVLQSVTHPVIGPTTVVGAPWRLDGHRPGVREPGPLLGQHNDQVLGELLGFSKQEIEELTEQGVVA